MVQISARRSAILTEVVRDFPQFLPANSSIVPCNRARQLCSGIHKVQEEGVGQEINGDELPWMKVGSTAGVISGLSPAAEKAGEDF
jgi:hypothetical protein